MKTICVGLIALMQLMVASTAAATPPGKKITHLDVKVGNIVYLSTFCFTVAEPQRTFFYDRDHNLPFVIPPGFSFVVTDILVTPFCAGASEPDAKWTVVVRAGPSGRVFGRTFRGDVGKTWSLTGGIVFTSGFEPEARAPGGPTGKTMQVALIGYFVKGKGLAPSVPRF